MGLYISASGILNAQYRNEVTAAFATAILSDHNIEKQLYHARSAAHAYELLHHDEAEDFNRFLED